MRIFNSFMVLALAVAGSWFIVPVPTAEAQRATDLVCNRCVQREEIADRAIAQKQLANPSVTSVNIRDRSILGIDVARDAISRNKIADEPGIDFASGEQLLELTGGNPKTVKSVNLTMPTSGYVLVNVSGYFAWLSGYGRASCSITDGRSIDGGHQFSENGNGSEQWDSFNATRTFFFDSGGTRRFRLVCIQRGTVAVGDPSISALFVPTRY